MNFKRESHLKGELLANHKAINSRRAGSLATDINFNQISPGHKARVQITNILLNGPMPAPLTRPLTISSKREQVIKHIADSMNEVKSIIDRLPDTFQKYEQPKSRELGEPAGMMTGKLTRTDSFNNSRPFGAKNIVRTSEEFRRNTQEAKTKIVSIQEKAINSRPKTSNSPETGSFDFSKNMMKEQTSKKPLLIKFGYNPSVNIVYLNSIQAKSGLKKGLTMSLNNKNSSDR